MSETTTDSEIQTLHTASEINADTRSLRPSLTTHLNRIRLPPQRTDNVVAVVGRSLLPEEPFQLRLGLVHFARVGRSVGTRAGLEVIAEVRLRLVGDFLCRGLAAMLCNARIVFDAHLAHVQLGTALGALVEPPQRQTQMRQRGTAIPADEVVAHGCKFTPSA
jgi:hypothetical protein